MNRILLIFICIIILSFRDSNFVKCETYTWIGETNSSVIGSYINQFLWDPFGIPLTNDSFILNNGKTILLEDLYIPVNYAKISNGLIYIFNGFLVANTSLDIFWVVSLERGNLKANESINFNEGVLVSRKYEDYDEFAYDCFVISPIINFSNDSLVSIFENSSTMIGGSNEIVNFRKSNIQLYLDSELSSLATIKLYENSTIKNLYGGRIVFLNATYESYDYSFINVFNTNLIFNDVYLYDESWIEIKGVESILNFMGNAVLNYNSQLIVSDSAKGIIIGDLVMKDNSMLFLLGVQDQAITTLYINGSLTCNDSSVVYTENSSIFVVGHYASFMILELFNTMIYIENNTIINGKVLSEYVTFLTKESLIINSPKMELHLSFYYSFSDTILNGAVYSSFSAILVRNGVFYANKNSKLYLEDSVIGVEVGNLIIDPESELTLIRSNLTVLKQGNIMTSSNIYLNENCLFKNNGSITLSSAIYFTNNTSLKSNEVLILNDGEFKIVNSTSINVAFNNNNGLVSVGNNNRIYIYQFEQNNNGSILLDGGIIDSDSEFKLNGGSVSGNGLLNSSINQQNGEFGSRLSTNRINITDNYIQSESGTIILIIDTIDDFSILNIGNNVDIQGNIEIRINTELISLIRDVSKQSNGSNSESSKSLGTFKVINYKSKTDQSFNPNRIKFKVYNPNSNDEDQEADSCISTTSSSTSLSLLVGSNDCNNSNKKLSGGVIAGIVIGIAAAVVIVGVAFHFRERLRLKVQYNKTVIRLSSKFTRK